MKYKILFLCDFYRNTTNTIVDHATSFEKHSEFEYYYFNPIRLNKPSWLDIDKFDIVIIHYSIYILGDYYINYSWREAISKTSAVKVQFIQDEYRKVNEFHQRMNELRINILFTCVPETEIEKVYPTERLPGVLKVSNLTGYVPEYLANCDIDFERDRPIDVGYRGRDIPMWLGELGQEKKYIGVKMVEMLEDTDIIYDISSSEEDRIYGEDWVKFLKDCRCSLGTESGASVFDFTGEIEENVKVYCKENPNATFKKVQELFLKDYEGKIYLNQISPRAFECIGCGSVMVLFEGDYSNILKPDEHYIMLKKDFSNIDEVISKIKDKDLVKRIARKAYNDIILSGEYSYSSFVKRFDSIIKEYMENRNESTVEVENTDVHASIPRKSLIWKMIDIAYVLAKIHPFFIRHYTRLRRLFRKI